VQERQVQYPVLGPGNAQGVTQANALPFEQNRWKVLLWALAIFAMGSVFGFAVVATQWVAELTLRGAAQ